MQLCEQRSLLSSIKAAKMRGAMQPSSKELLMKQFSVSDSRQTALLFVRKTGQASFFFFFPPLPPRRTRLVQSNPNWASRRRQAVRRRFGGDGGGERGRSLTRPSESSCSVDHVTDCLSVTLTAANRRSTLVPDSHAFRLEADWDQIWCDRSVKRRGTISTAGKEIQIII